MFHGTQVVLPLLATTLFMLALRPFARGVGLIDKPGGRKAHVGEIPIIGGLAMLAGILVGGVVSPNASQTYPYFVASSVILVLVGSVDDRYDLPPSVRFLAQTCAALMMIYGADVVVKGLGDVTFGAPVMLGWISPIFTLLLVLTAVNAINMFDGSDGVAGVQALNGLVFFGFAAVMSGNTYWLPLIGNLVGVVLGFLVFNWPSRRTTKVRAFMGDAGSTLLGFALAWVGVALSQGEGRSLSPIVVLWIFALPVFDLFSSMIRRVSSGRSPFHADSEHLHHILKRWGWSSRRVAQVILLTSAMTSGLGVWGYLYGISDGLLLMVWLLSFVIYHVVFGSNLVIKRRVEPRIGLELDLEDTESIELWRQRR